MNTSGMYNVAIGYTATVQFLYKTKFLECDIIRGVPKYLKPKDIFEQTCKQCDRRYINLTYGHESCCNTGLGLIKRTHNKVIYEIKCIINKNL